MLDNFQHNPDRVQHMLRVVRDMTSYFHDAIRQQRDRPREGLVSSLMSAVIDGDRLTDEEVVAPCIMTMVGGLETTTNLIGNGVLTLLRNPAEMKRVRNDLT